MEVPIYIQKFAYRSLPATYQLLPNDLVREAAKFKLTGYMDPVNDLRSARSLQSIYRSDST